jgi:hypothetical protein
MHLDSKYSIIIGPDDFDLDRMMLTLKALEDGPIKIMRLIREIE